MKTPLLATPLFGLRLYPTDAAAALRAIALAVLAMTTVAVLADCFVFRQILPLSYVAPFSGPNRPQVAIRVLLFVRWAIGDELLWRGVVMTGLVAIGAVVWRRTASPPAIVFIGAIALSQGIALAFQLPPAASPSVFSYDAIRYYLPGLVWGWLYWRHGWVSAFVAHTATHALLQPLLQFFL